jgi:hypothetical protein
MESSRQDLDLRESDFRGFALLGKEIADPNTLQSKVRESNSPCKKVGRVPPNRQLIYFNLTLRPTDPYSFQVEVIQQPPCNLFGLDLD